MTKITVTNNAEPDTPASGRTVIYADSTTKTLKAKDDTGLVTAYGDNKKVLLSSNDTTEDYIENKFVDSATVEFVVSSDGGDEKITANSLGSGPALSLSGATYTTMQDNVNLFHSSGVSSWSDMSDDGDGTITVTAGTGFIKATDSEVVPLYAFDWASEAGANVSLVDNDLNYVYVEYNAGTPRVVATTVKRTEYNTNVYLGSVYRIGTDLHITSVSHYHIGDHASRMIRRMQCLMPFAHESGSAISEVGTRNIAITAGVYWQGLVEYSTPAVDTSASGTYSAFYSDGASGFTEVTAQTQINNTQYDDGSGTLATLSNNQYGVHWLFVGVDGDFYVVYGEDSYTLIDAEDSKVPVALPPHFEGHARIIGRIIIAKSASTFTLVTSAFDTAFTTGTPTDHEDLVNLLGGAAAEHYHLTLAQHTVATQSASASVSGLMDTSTQTFAGDKTFTGALSSPAVGSGSESFGISSASAGAQGTAIGNGASSAGAQGVAVGYLADAAASQATAVGYLTYALATATAIGRSASAAASGAMAFGFSTSATATAAMAIGYDATCAHANSIAMGRVAATTAIKQFVAGSQSYPMENVYFGGGVENAVPSPTNINGTSGLGTDIVGAAVSFNGGQGTGTGAGGGITLKTAPAGTTGSSKNALVSQFLISGEGQINTPNLATHADEAAAVTAGLATGDWYQTSTGELRIKL